MIFGFIVFLNGSSDQEKYAVLTKFSSIKKMYYKNLNLFIRYHQVVVQLLSTQYIPQTLFRQMKLLTPYGHGKSKHKANQPEK